MNKKQARNKAKRDVSCLDVGGFEIVRLGIGTGTYEYNYVAVGGPVNHAGPLVVEQWRLNVRTQKWEKR